MKILVLGAGAWGTAMAVSASQAEEGGQLHHAVTLWGRDGAHASAMRSTRTNARYLSGVSLPEALVLKGGEAELESLLLGQDLIVLATPVSAARSWLQRLQNSRTPVAWLSKGFEAPPAVQGEAPNSTLVLPQSCKPFGATVGEIRAQVAINLRAGVLSGPSFALEVARGQPTALVAASEHHEVREAMVSAFHSRTLRVYASDDVVGVEVGGAVKNVLAIAAGLCDGLGLGMNARAALITRGLAEMTRLGVALGAHAETFTGLSGLGDLVLTATGDLSRNRKVGLLLAQGQSLHEAVSSLGHVAEGVYCARTVEQRALALGVEMPITQAVVALLDGRLRPDEAVALLMERQPRTEQA